MTNDEINNLVDKYWRKEGYKMPDHFEHRYDPDSSAILYSLIRKYKPVSCLEIGTWRGGSSHIIMSALLKNQKEIKKKFHYVASELADDLRDETYKNVSSICGEGPRMIGDITMNLARIPSHLDFLMIDTDHDLKTTEWIVANVFPHVKRGALLSIHDWAVEEKDGKLVGKGELGTGGWEETNYYMDMIRGGKWPFKKIYWTYGNPAWPSMSPTRESAFWEKI